MELVMKRLLIAATAVAVLGLPPIAVAQTKKDPGHSESAPGQRATKPGDAKKYAPGQQEHRSDKDKLPGAKEYAPGHQPNK